MKDPKKDVALLIASKLGKPDNMKEAPQSEEGAELDQSIGFKSAAEEIIKAVESKDSSMLMEALKSFHQMCQDEEYSEPEASEEPKE